MRRTLVLAILLGGCGGPPPVAPSSYDDLDLDDERRLSIGGIVLPRMPLDVAPDDPELEVGWDRASQALSMPTPRAPVGEDWEIEAWADEELAGWMTRRAESIGQAQRALENARQGDAEHSVVASAILGLAYSRFALDLRGIPTPDAFARSEERARAFQEALRGASLRLWQRALDAFGSCSSVASGEPAHSLDQWREFCDVEIRNAQAMLPSEDDEEEEEERDERD
jgi:hypothetical protein